MTESYRRSGDETPQDRTSADGNDYASADRNDYASAYGYGSQYAQSAHDGVPGGAGQEVPPPPSYAPSSRRRPRRPVALIAAVALISSLIGGGSAALISDATDRATQNTSSTPLVNAGDKPSGSGVSAVAKAVSPAIVEIKARTANGESTGSGVVVTSSGEIVTNNHVVAGARTVTVTFSDGSRKTAKVVGTDPDKDLAMVKVSGAKNLTAAQLGDSDKIAVGDQVVAIGSPEGLTGSVTSGIVSALNRDVTVPKEESQGQQGNGGDDGGWPFEFGGRQFNGDTGSSKTSYKAIQTDASLNPGNSGGALINMQGQIIGINSAMYAPSSGAAGSSGGSAGSIGLGFAIPINTVKADLDSLRGGGSGGSNSGV
ncbi:S1C family serine protease [Streptomyces sp. 2314.4]|uniref:S1C family serine protease n=1 Tax=Streptomyces sp. 2314.4 TaxID=1881025 RepID=UPI00089A58BB|nr:trypsin-like peptidase domain-containing protein [Streptomyces sp. 2314.4]SEE27629.1 putative serine protease PepD [Streptomyces sp. 2314.4]